jgi:hypothetical protein
MSTAVYSAEYTSQVEQRLEGEQHCETPLDFQDIISAGEEEGQAIDEVRHVWVCTGMY